MTLAFVGVEECLRRPWLVVQRMGGQQKTPLLDAPRLSSCQGGSQSAFNLIDHPRGSGAGAWAPPLTRIRDGTNRDLGAWGHL
jgi:hypothetical protein